MFSSNRRARPAEAEGRRGRAAAGRPHRARGTRGHARDAGTSGGPGVGRPRLTEDETTVLMLLARGCTTDAVARAMGVSERTVRRRVESAAAELGTRNTTQAIVTAVRAGLVD